ncbi:zinc finger, CCHC-type [Artemisia annua]|uniref:Zinc finger, CCHC-type n=1 Tax=Artemisia annua TaxID=35608 RepID=A0A2U1KV23_ARTAN|nr:zinc finger, CCHC-type [Artemisia annua]
MNNSSIRSILEKEKLNEALPEAPADNATAAVRNAYNRRKNEQQEVACLMLASMIPELQKNLENLAAFDMLRELKVMFEQQAEQELFDTVRSFHACKQEEGQSVSSYVMKMKGYLDQMDRLGYPMPQILGVSLILTSLERHAQEGSSCPSYQQRQNSEKEQGKTAGTWQGTRERQGSACLCLQTQNPPTC